MFTALSLTSDLQNCETINVCFFSPSLWLWHPELTNTCGERHLLLKEFRGGILRTQTLYVQNKQVAISVTISSFSIKVISTTTGKKCKVTKSYTHWCHLHSPGNQRSAGVSGLGATILTQLSNVCVALGKLVPYLSVLLCAVVFHL